MQYEEELCILVAAEGLKSCKSSSSSVSYLYHQWKNKSDSHYRKWIICLPTAPGTPRSAIEGHDKFKCAQFQTKSDLADLVASCSTMLLLSVPLLFSSLLTLLEVRQKHFPSCCLHPNCCTTKHLKQSKAVKSNSGPLRNK